MATNGHRTHKQKNKKRPALLPAGAPPMVKKFLGCPWDMTHGLHRWKKYKINIKKETHECHRKSTQKRSTHPHASTRERCERWSRVPPSSHSHIQKSVKHQKHSKNKKFKKRPALPLVGTPPMVKRSLGCPWDARASCT